MSYQLRCSPTRYARSPVRYCRSPVRYARPVRSAQNGCFVGVPTIQAFGVTVNDGNNPGYDQCVASNYPGVKAGKTSPSFNYSTSFNNSYIKGPLGICCSDYADLAKSAKNLTIDDNYGIVSAAICKKPEKMDNYMNGLIPFGGWNLVSPYIHQGISTIGNMVPSTMTVKLPASLKPDGVPVIIPIKNAICGDPNVERNKLPEKIEELPVTYAGDDF